MNTSTELSQAMGTRIQQARRIANMTQRELAEKIDVSTQYISDLERGIVGCSITTLLGICNTLNVSSDFILKGFDPSFHETLALFDRFSELSPQRQQILRDLFELMNRAFSTK